MSCNSARRISAVLLFSGYCRLAVSAPPESRALLKDYIGIDNIHSQQFSVAIFVFMVLAISLFAGIVVASMARKSSKPLKPGEKWLFAWIFFGIVVSVVFGALQLLGGYLF